MITRLSNGQKIDWDETFNHSTSIREVTYEFAIGNICGTEWIRQLWCVYSTLSAKKLIRTFGVDGTRRRARRWFGDEL